MSELKQVPIHVYLKDLSTKNKCQYDYGITSNPGKEGQFYLTIRRLDNGISKVAYEGPMFLLNSSLDLYYVDFPKSGIKCVIYFFM
jgi:hypothetical protein